MFRTNLRKLALAALFTFVSILLQNSIAYAETNIETLNWAVYADNTLIIGATLPDEDLYQEGTTNEEALHGEITARGSDLNLGETPYIPWAEDDEIKNTVTSVKFGDKVAPISMENLFSGFQSLTSFDKTNLDTSSCTNLNATFQNCKNLKFDQSLLYGLDTSNVTSMVATFKGCKQITTLNFLSHTNLNKVSDFSEAFMNCENLYDFGGLRLSAQATSIHSIFENDTKLTNLSPITSWDTSNLQDMSRAFYGTKLLNLNEFQYLDLTNVKSLKEAFAENANLQEVSAFGALSSNLQDMEGIFRNCNSLTSVSGLATSDLSGVSTIKEAFLDCYNLINADGLGSFGQALKDASHAFSGDTSLENINALSACDLSGVETLESAFDNCLRLQSLDGLNNVGAGLKNLSSAFYECLALEDASALGTEAVVNIQNLDCAFYKTKIQNLDFCAAWNTNKVTTMVSAFEECEELTDVAGLSQDEWQKLQNVSRLFYNCKNLVVADLYGFSPIDGASLGSAAAEESFANCENLTTIICKKSWNNYSTSNAWGSSTFFNCRQIKSTQSGQTFNGLSYGSDMCNAVSGYFTTYGEIEIPNIFRVQANDCPADVDLSSLYKSNAFSFTVKRSSGSTSINPDIIEHGEDGAYKAKIIVKHILRNGFHSSFSVARTETTTAIWQISQNVPNDARFIGGYDKDRLYIKITAKIVDGQCTISAAPFKDSMAAQPIDEAVFENEYASVATGPNITVQHYIWFDEIDTNGTSKTKLKFLDTTNPDGYKPTSTDYDSYRFSDQSKTYLPTGDVAESAITSMNRLVNVDVVEDDPATPDNEAGRLKTNRILTRLFVDENVDLIQKPTMQTLDRLFSENNKNYSLTSVWVANPTSAKEIEEAKAANTVDATYSSGQKIFSVYNIPPTLDDLLNIKFTSDADNADIDFVTPGDTAPEKDSYTIYVEDDSVIRFVFNQTTDTVNRDANLFDYDITNGGFWTSCGHGSKTNPKGQYMLGTYYPTSKQQEIDAKNDIYLNGSLLNPGEPANSTENAGKYGAGIHTYTNYGNSILNGSHGAAKFAYGNATLSDSVDAGNGLDQSAKNAKQNGRVINQYNRNSFGGCAFNLVQGLQYDSQGYPCPVWASGVWAPNIFGRADSTVSVDGQTVSGKTTFQDYSLRFYQQGETFTLDGVDKDGYGSTNDDLRRFTKHICGSAEVIANDFWPLEKGSDTWGQDGHDIKFGASGGNTENAPYDGKLYSYTTGTYQKRRMYGSPWTYTSPKLPISDDCLDHNSFFGMSYEVEFSLVPGYIGPLEYWFYGDDDMWVFVDNTDDNLPATKIADVGGVHSSVGEYVNLWDYVNPVSADSEHVSHYKLTVLYDERGASGSSCYMRFTIPTEPIGLTGNLAVTKDVVGEGAPDMEFPFKVTLSDTTINGRYGDLQFTNGVAEFSVRDSMTLTAKNLPYGISYTVEEQTPGMFNARWENQAGVVGEIGKTTKIICSNIWKGQLFNLVANKAILNYANDAITNWNWDENPFTFELSSAAGAPLPDATTVETDENGKVTWENIVLPGPGDYVYEMKEILPAELDENMHYDDSVHTLKVTLHEGDEHLMTYELDGKQIDASEISITNIWGNATSYTPMMIKEVRDYLTGKPIAVPADTFEFEMKAIDNAPLPEETVTMASEGGEVKWGDIDYERPGVYTYDVVEHDLGDRQYIYDDNTYKLIVDVEEITPNLEASAVWYDPTHESGSTSGSTFGGVNTNSSSSPVKNGVASYTLTVKTNASAYGLDENKLVDELTITNLYVPDGVLPRTGKSFTDFTPYIVSTGAIMVVGATYINIRKTKIQSVAATPKHVAHPRTKTALKKGKNKCWR